MPCGLKLFCLRSASAPTHNYYLLSDSQISLSLKRS